MADARNGGAPRALLRAFALARFAAHFLRCAPRFLRFCAVLRVTRTAFCAFLGARMRVYAPHAAAHAHLRAFHTTVTLRLRLPGLPRAPRIFTTAPLATCCARAFLLPLHAPCCATYHCTHCIL